MNKSIVIIFVIAMVVWTALMFMNRKASSIDLLDACVKILQKDAKSDEDVL